MRMSCNGCRVLRKGCSDNCSIRPCLEWIKSPDSQAHATVFLAKFYGRAGLMNLVNAGPPHLRPAIFRSLLYEACGRIVNPIYGSVGLLWSGSWQLCQSAVEAVLKGAPITQIAADAAETENGPPLKAYDIRHVNQSGSGDVVRVRNRYRFKRSKRSRVVRAGPVEEPVRGSPSHGSSLSHQSEPNVESLASAAEPDYESARGDERRADEGGVELDLGLGFTPFERSVKPRVEGAVGCDEDDEAGFCKMELGLDYAAFCDVDGSDQLVH